MIYAIRHEYHQKLLRIRKTAVGSGIDAVRNQDSYYWRDQHFPDQITTVLIKES